MHRTDGLNNENGRYTEGPPPTTITPEHLNSIQEEICTVIEDDGTAVQVSSTDTHDQLLTAIISKIPLYDYTINTQDNFDDAIERTAANAYRFKTAYKSIYLKSGIYYLTLTGGDTYGVLTTNQVTHFEGDNDAYINFGDTASYISVDTEGCLLKNIKVKGNNLTAVAVTTSFLLSANLVTFDNCIIQDRYSNTTMYGFQGSSTTLHNKTSKYMNCVVRNIRSSSHAIVPFYLCENMKNCIEYNIDNTGNYFVNDNPRAYWTSARQIGTSLTIAGGPADGELTALTQSTIAYIDGVLESLRHYTWNNNVWVLDGAGLTINATASPAITALNSTDVAFVDMANQSLRKYRWSVNSWALVGAGLTVSCDNPTLAAVNSTDVAFADDNPAEIRTYRWSTNSWAMIGSGFSIAGILRPAIAAMNDMDIAYVDTAAEELKKYRWSVNSWALIGSGLSIAGINFVTITAMNETDVTVLDGTTDTIKIYRFDGANWSVVGGSSYIISIDDPKIAALNGTDIAFFDSNSATLRRYRFDYQMTNNPYGRGDLL